MSDTDSFIDEVSEEVRRDRLYALMRRWGWVAILAVILLVGGAAWTEWQRSRAEASAQRFGDGVIAAVGADTAEARAAALAALDADGEGQAFLRAMLLAAAEAAPDAEGGGADAAEAAPRLLELAETPGLAPRHRHLALLKAILAGGTSDVIRDGEILAELATPGAPYRPIAVEMQALRALEAGDEGTAVTLLRLLAEDAEASAALRARAQQLMVALGAQPTEPA
ncbi:hypothetical protein [Jannaschia sp. W003]|uniref:hypothetical protein n=1 Tax=Jannaschia sp. W003 TaxID=2867012 RepID=UPI0021A4E283|nr:hypothetical protein [Jannaschia sp. W003]UWQ20230.1 hypothetical protein K3554_09470 [Jannaschia sp. W003]